MRAELEDPSARMPSCWQKSESCGQNWKIHRRGCRHAGRKVNHAGRTGRSIGEDAVTPTQKWITRAELEDLSARTPSRRHKSESCGQNWKIHRRGRVHADRKVNHAGRTGRSIGEDASTPIEE